MLKFILFIIPCILVFLYPVSPVQLPDDLKFLKKGNSTSVDDDTSHCMEELRKCLNPHTISPICGVNAMTDRKQSFESMCELIHENCRSKKDQWHYLSDKIENCTGTFGDSSKKSENSSMLLK
ncbi:uncharacterized protein LOC134675334 [Cydia fagiglandana]|uniref:uncharacterized protein LOC134675334 n=1 Tax=Cydia fagiglandana TaxID=1458189 RepID=UPI002FEE5522